MSNKTIFISAGHGGSPNNFDPGACANGAREADIVLELRNLIAEILRAAGVSVLTDGVDDQNKSLPEAIKLAQTAGPVRVEFHCNAAGNPAAGGVECLSAASQSPLAKSLCSTIANILQISVRGGNSGWKAEDSGQHHRLGFISQGHGIICELFFITNADELAKYEERKHTLAQALAHVLLEANK